MGGEVGIDVGLFSSSELSEVYTIGGADGMSLDLSATCDSKDDSSVALLVYHRSSVVPLTSPTEG